MEESSITKPFGLFFISPIHKRSIILLIIATSHKQNQPSDFLNCRDKKY